MHSIRIDWAQISSEDGMWDALCRESKEPMWHGRNLDALNDSWVAGGINEMGPPYQFHFLNCSKVAERLARTASAVMDIARTSVAENGGAYDAKP
ncbi:MAG: barstar family protein [Nevskia sp.]|nr:barstar family protein [Nevskia sp.]